MTKAYALARGRQFVVTGGAGFIGSHLVEAILAAGGAVRVFDNFATGHRRNLDAVLEAVQGRGQDPQAPWPGSWDARYALLEGDIREASACREACVGAELVLHQAALGSVPRSVEDPLTTHEVNGTGTLNMLIAARDAGAERFVHASSSSVYGDTEVLPKVETMAPRPISPYAVSKLMGEAYGEVFTRLYGLPTLGLRYFNVFGPRQDPDSQYAAVIPLFFRHLLAGEAPTVFGDGEQTRDFTYIDNVVEANLLACQVPAERLDGRSVNVACDFELTVNALYAAIARRVGTDLAPKYVDPRAGDVRASRADIGQIQEILGYTGAVDVEAGLELATPWYRKFLGTELDNSKTRS